ncbi:MAG: DUF6036 family nucleotidyltransferase [Oscillospiraceae bacterium]|nr:DUF6036 family nucleotidyltransferase [Oscillospiraceae bacterium]
MSFDIQFTKENLNTYLKELGKEFRKLNGTKMPAEIILIGGAAILANYSFREMTYDIDAIILASSAMKEAINHVGDKLNLPTGWLNEDFKNTKSYSNKLLEVSIYYKTFSNILTIRTVSAEYLVAMKLMSGRRYKNDLSDIAGILREHQRNGTPITQEAVSRAVTILYGSWTDIPVNSKKFIEAAFKSGDYETMYLQNVDSENQSKDILIDFDKSNPGKLRKLDGEDISTILEQARRKRQNKKINRN